MNATENPFRVSRVHALPFLWPGDTRFDTLTTRWTALGQQGAIVGPHGTGKTTLLNAWAAHLREQGRDPRLVTLTEEFPRLPPDAARLYCDAGKETVAMLDGAEQLGLRGWRRWLRLTRRAGGRAVTLHRPGRLPTLLQTQARLDQLEHLLRILLDGDLSQLPAPPAVLLQRNQNNIRLVFRACYEWFAR